MSRTFVALLLLAVAGCGSPPAPTPAPAVPPAFPGGALVDLSHPYDAQAIFWPTAAPFRLSKVHDGMTTSSAPRRVTAASRMARSC